jgi:ribosomal protein S18 acetylase RimI-like enzyme
MIKRFVLLFLVSISLTQTINSKEFTDKSGDLIYLSPCQKEDLSDCEAIFINAFSKAYEDFTPEQLGVKDKLLFLKEAFADVYDDLQMGLQKLLVAKIEEKVVGFVGFKKTEKPHQIYISQLAVDPEHSRKGIGTHLVFSVFDHFEDTENLVVIPRRINLIAKQFYSKLGFVESSYMHPGYSPQKYVGYEWTKQ